MIKCIKISYPKRDIIQDLYTWSTTMESPTKVEICFDTTRNLHIISTLAVKYADTVEDVELKANNTKVGQWQTGTIHVITILETTLGLPKKA